MSEINAKLTNELFLQRLDTDMEKVASEAGAFIRQKLREVSFARKIINPQYVTKADLQRSTKHEGLVKIIDIEPDSSATEISLRGTPDVQYVEGDRFEMTFGNVSSKEFQKVEEELLAYEMPITEIIERNTVKDIQRVEDEIFMRAVNSAIAVTGKSDTYTTSSAGTIELGAFVKLYNTLEDTTGLNPLKTETILMSQVDYNKLLALPSTTIGSQVAGEVYVNGFAYTKFQGKNLVVTNKADLVPPKTIYAFASQEFLGKFLVLNDTRFFVEKRRNLIKWSAMQTIGLSIINNKGCAKVTLSQ